jgi:cell division protein FtsL
LNSDIKGLENGIANKKQEESNLEKQIENLLNEMS